MHRLADQLSEALSAFVGVSPAPALIGGLALAAHKVVRATRDIDFLANADDADLLHSRLLALGYRCIHRSADAANYLRADEGLDLLYAHRPQARQLLAEATERETQWGRVRVIGAEGLIGFKLQGFVNSPERVRDLDDIRALLRANRGQLDLAKIRGYFGLFDREGLFDELLADSGS